MNKTQYLLMKLAEEASEVAQAALKTMQFGFSSINPYEDKSNLHMLYAELNDLIGVTRALQDSNKNFCFVVNETSITNKLAKLEKYWEISKSLGFAEEKVNAL